MFVTKTKILILKCTTMEPTSYFCSKRRQMKKIILGILLITAGALLLGFNAGLIDPAYRHIIFSWPMFLIAIGLMNIFSRESLFSGFILLLIGTFFILPHLFFLPEDFVHNFWPAILIIIGIVIIARRTIFHNYLHNHFHRYSSSDLKDENGYINISNIFGGGKHKAPPVEFKGGKIANIFGGTELDLTQATLPQGTTVLDIECIFGGIGIIVPSDWNITVKVSSIMGGFSDKRTVIKNTSSDRELVIKGAAIFGGGDIKSY
jgi:predicted membrane protein